VDLEVFSPEDRDAARNDLGLSGRDRAIAFRGVARDEHGVKGMAVLRRALQSLRLDDPVTLLVVDNDGGSFAELDGQFRVRRLGWLGEPALSRILAAADVFVMPSEHESFGMMAVEAMACGTPVLAFDETAVAEVIRPPEGGVVVPALDHAALAAAIRSLLSDDSLRESMRKSARSVAERYYPFHRYVDRHIALYRSLLEERA